MLKKIIDALGLSESDTVKVDEPGSAAVRAVADKLDGIPQDRAKLIAALAMVLARAARADLDASNREMALIASILQQYADLTAEQADLVTEMVAHRNQLFGSGEDYLATREFKNLASEHELDCILKCLFAVCAADDSISLVEEEEVRQVATELGFTHEEYTSARAKFRDQREVLKGLRSD
jgi:uncharacterized tellurite resistance protein B-like protein